VIDESVLEELLAQIADEIEIPPTRPKMFSTRSRSRRSPAGKRVHDSPSRC